MPEKLDDFDAARAEIARLQGRLDQLRHGLARRVGGGELPDGPFEVLIVRVEEQRLGLPLAGVEEVILVAATTPIPESPPWISGLLDLRGQPVLVLDLAARIARDSRELEIGDLIIVCRTAEMLVGLIVQEVLDIARCDPSKLADATAEKEQAPYVLGVATLGDHQVQLLSLGSLLSLSELPETAA